MHRTAPVSSTSIVDTKNTLEYMISMNPPEFSIDMLVRTLTLLSPYDKVRRLAILQEARTIFIVNSLYAMRG